MNDKYAINNIYMPICKCIYMLNLTLHYTSIVNKINNYTLTKQYVRFRL